MKRLLVVAGLLVLFFLSGAVVAQELDAKKIDALVEKSRDTFKAPGVAVAVVRNDKVVYQKGFGERRLGKGEPITEETIFAIASMTKPITAFLIALLMADGKIDWDVPVRKYLPSFRLSDPTAEREITLRDMLCHRSGLPRHDFVWSSQQGWNREELMRRTGLVTPTKGFRDEYQYNNLMFMIAGHAAGTVDGKSWEDSLRKRVFDPLGMKHAVPNARLAEKQPNAARPHFKREEKVVEIPFNNIEQLGAAGSIHASVQDLARWMRLQLNRGELDGKRILAEKYFDTMHKPHVVVNEEPNFRSLPEELNVQSTYGLGWKIFDYRGYKLMSHNGAIDGFTSVHILVPKAKLGVVVFNNLQSSPLPGAVALQIIDEALGFPKTDWNAHYQTLAKRSIKDGQAPVVKRDATQKKNTKPSLELDAYAGKYEHPGYGVVTIETKDGALRLTCGRHDFPLRHFHFDVFVLAKTPEPWRSFGDETATFRLSTAGEVESLRFVGQDFTREKAKTKTKKK